MPKPQTFRLRYLSDFPEWENKREFFIRGVIEISMISKQPAAFYESLVVSQVSYSLVLLYNSLLVHAWFAGRTRSFTDLLSSKQHSIGTATNSKRYGRCYNGATTKSHCSNDSIRNSENMLSHWQLSEKSKNLKIASLSSKIQLLKFQGKDQSS